MEEMSEKTSSQESTRKQESKSHTLFQKGESTPKLSDFTKTSDNETWCPCTFENLPHLSFLLLMNVWQSEEFPANSSFFTVRSDSDFQIYTSLEWALPPNVKPTKVWGQVCSVANELARVVLESHRRVISSDDSTSTCDNWSEPLSKWEHWTPRCRGRILEKHRPRFLLKETTVATVADMEQETQICQNFLIQLSACGDVPSGGTLFKQTFVYMFKMW